MPNLRSFALRALRQFNSQNGITTRVSGKSAQDASLQVAKLLGTKIRYAGPLSHVTISSRSTPFDTGCKPLLLGKKEHMFPIRSSLRKDIETISLRRYSNLTVHNWMDFYIVTNKDGIVKELSSAYAPLALTNLCPGSKMDLTVPPQARVDNLYLWAADCDFSNYCHFMYDYLPQLSFLRDIDLRIEILMPEPSMEFHALCGKLFSRKWSSFRLRHGESVLVSNLYSLSPRILHPLFRCSWWAIDYLCSKIAAPPSTQQGEVLYVSRSRRVARNEGKLLDAIRANGIRVDTVKLENLEISEQIVLFRSYRALLGVHGAGFTNIVFGQNSIKKVLEILPMGVGTPAFAMVSSRLDIDHAIIGVDPIPTAHPNHPDSFLSKRNISDICDFLLD
jgi:hypothetical protein